jgi:hypothetical protein
MTIRRSDRTKREFSWAASIGQHRRDIRKLKSKSRLATLTTWMARTDDDAAIERAQQLVDGNDVELWQRARKIATLDHGRKSSPNWTNQPLLRLIEGSVAMADNREELKRRLEQARRMLKEGLDPLTKERLAQLIRDIEEQLR